MRFVVPLLITLLSSQTPAGPPSARSLAPLILGTGEQRLLTLPGLQRYSIGSDHVRAVPVPTGSAELDPDVLLLKGVTEGLSDLWVWKSDGSSEHRAIRVEKWRPAGKSDLPRALAALSEVEVIALPPGALLRGEIRSDREAALIARLLETHASEVRSHAIPTPSLLADAIHRLGQWLGSSPFGRSVRVEQRGHELWIAGSSPSTAEADAIKEQARAVFPLVHFDLSALPSSAPTVFFRVFLVEAKEDEVTRFGLRWPEIVGNFQVTPWAIRRSIDVPVALEALAREGRIRILSKPSLALRVPGQASLFSGGELPIRNKSHYTSDVAWRRHGLSLMLRAEAFAGEVVRLEVLAAVSQLDTSNGNDEIPGIRSNQLKTQVDARLGVPLLLSGLTQERESTSRSGLPWLSKIPLLGSLFGTQEVTRERAELLAVLLPQSSPPRPPMEELKEEYPKGPVPPPRNWIPLAALERLKASGEYPWNVFEEAR